MKRMALIFAVLLMTLPAMAETFVDISCVSDVNEVTVSYNVTGSSSLVRGFGLDIQITSGDANITKVWWDPNGSYRIFPGQIHIDYGEVTDYNYPYESDDLGDANVTIEMGSLYTWDTNYMGDANAGYGKEPNQNGILLKFYVSGNCHYTITENAARGGIVLEDPEEDPNVDSPLCEGDVIVGCVVPDVLDMDETEATTAIGDAGLVVGDVTYECSNVEAADEVLAQDPCGGLLVACGSDVNLVVSLGQPVVPNVIGETEANAKAIINAVDFISAGTVTCNWHPTATVGNIIDQDPDAGTAPCGTVVNLLVCVSNTRPDNPIPDDPNYAQQWDDANTYIDYGWEPNGCSPGGWGKKYHCFGDADGATEGIITKYRVSMNDLNVVIPNWKKKMGAWPTGANPAADIDHKYEGIITKYRVSMNDLNRIVCYWKKKDADLDGNPRGPCPWKDSVNNAWSCP